LPRFSHCGRSLRLQSCSTPDSTYEASSPIIDLGEPSCFVPLKRTRCCPHHHPPHQPAVTRCRSPQ
jgi:hypothetical protein